MKVIKHGDRRIVLDNLVQYLPVVSVWVKGIRFYHTGGDFVINFETEGEMLDFLQMLDEEME